MTTNDRRRSKSSATPEQLERVHRRMSMFAYDLAARLGAMDAAGALIGGAGGVLEQTNGQAKALEYLRELTIELECDDLPPIDGHKAGHA